jgi:transcriptional regulator with XRE-family HTH domain
MAKMLQVSSSMLQHIENGHRNPSTLFLRRAAGLFQVSTDELLGLGAGGRRRCPECLGKGWVYDDR